MSYLDWHVGMKVVCVKEGSWRCVNDEDPGHLNPKFGEICTIREFFCDGENLYIGLDGYRPCDVFHVERFRPLESRKTDISIFTAMLNPAKKREVA